MIPDSKISRLAIKDLSQIWTYTAHNWSIKQADIYYDLIINQIQAICRNPQLGKSISDIKQHHRISQINSHLIVYKRIDNTIYSDRVLHYRMDIESHLTHRNKQST